MSKLLIFSQICSQLIFQPQNNNKMILFFIALSIQGDIKKENSTNQDFKHILIFSNSRNRVQIDQRDRERREPEREKVTYIKSLNTEAKPQFKLWSPQPSEESPLDVVGGGRRSLY